MAQAHTHTHRSPSRSRSLGVRVRRLFSTVGWRHTEESIGGGNRMGIYRGGVGYYLPRTVTNARQRHFHSQRRLPATVPTPCRDITLSATPSPLSLSLPPSPVLPFPVPRSTLYLLLPLRARRVRNVTSISSSGPGSSSLAAIKRCLWWLRRRDAAPPGRSGTLASLDATPDAGHRRRVAGSAWFLRPFVFLTFLRLVW